MDVLLLPTHEQFCVFSVQILKRLREGTYVFFDNMLIKSYLNNTVQ